MRFSKEELKVLDLYSSLADSKYFLNDKFCMHFNKEIGKVELIQSSMYGVFITVFEKDCSSIQNSFKIVGLTSQINQLIKLAPDADLIEITEKGIQFGKFKYEVPKFDYDITPLNYFLRELAVAPENTIKITNVKKLSDIKGFLGIDGLDMFGLFEGHFVSSNRADFTGTVKTNNITTVSKFFPKLITTIVSYFDIDEFEVSEVQKDGAKYDFIKINNTYIFFSAKDTSLENIFDPEIKSLYWHPSYIQCDKAKILEALQRISIVAQANIFNRIFFTVEQNLLKIESKDNNYACEDVESVFIDPSLIGYTFIVSANNIKFMIQQLQGKLVTIRCLNDFDAVAITITDEVEDKFFIHNLYENIDSN